MSSWPAGGPALNDTKVDITAIAEDLFEDEAEQVATPRRFLWLAIVPVALLLLLATVAFVFGQPYVDERTVPPGVIVLRGNVETATESSVSPVTAGTTVQPGAVIRTTTGAEAAVHFADGSAIRLRPESELRIGTATERLLAPGMLTGLLQAFGLYRDIPPEPTVLLALDAELLKGEALVLTPDPGTERSTLVVRAGPLLVSGADTTYLVQLTGQSSSLVRSFAGTPYVFGIGRSGVATAGLLASLPVHRYTEVDITGDSAEVEQWIALGRPLMREAIRRGQAHVAAPDLEAVGRVSETGAIIYANASGARPSTEDLRRIAGALDLLEDDGLGTSAGAGEFISAPFVLKPVGPEAFRDNLPGFISVRPVGGNVLWASTPFGAGPLWLEVKNGGLSIAGLPPGLRFPGLPGAFVQVAGVGDTLNVVYAPIGEG